jgi:2,4-dienoyl-CoA reductase-like NADH-dependent reductase (Old Yellow Enzyme family)
MCPPVRVVVEGVKRAKESYMPMFYTLNMTKCKQVHQFKVDATLFHVADSMKNMGASTCHVDTPMKHVDRPTCFMGVDMFRAARSTLNVGIAACFMAPSTLNVEAATKHVDGDACDPARLTCLIAHSYKVMSNFCC